MVEQVRPVVLPLFPTLSPSMGTPMVPEGGCAAMLVVPTAPRSRTGPLRSTCPATISAMAASTLLGTLPQSGGFDVPQAPGMLTVGLSAAPWVRCATVRGGLLGPVQASCKG